MLDLEQHLNDFSFSFFLFFQINDVRYLFFWAYSLPKSPDSPKSCLFTFFPMPG